MTSIWPWLAVAGAGALHGLNPCTGWGLAAACGLRARSGRQALTALLPIAAGHAASILAVAVMVALGLSTRGLAMLAGVLLPGVLWLCHVRPRLRERAGHAGLALWSFAAATAHGTGLMLVPALVPLCLGSSPAKEITASGSLLLALAAVAVHMAAMLAVAALVSLSACGARDLLRAAWHKRP